MPAMRKLPFPLLCLAVAVLTSSAGCKKLQQAGIAPAPQLELRPAAAARADLAATIVLPSPEKTLASVSAMAKRLSLPFAGGDLEQMLVARAKLPAAIIDRLDLSKPATMVMVVLPKKGAGEAGTTAEPALSIALKDTSKAGFDALAAAAGKVLETSKDAAHVQPGDGGEGFWMVPREGAICLAETLDRLVAGCALALEARKSAGQDLKISLIPEGMARASGTTLQASLDKVRQDFATVQSMTQASGGDPKLQASAAKMVGSMFGWILDAIRDTSEARIGVGLDATKGTNTTFELLPRAGTPLAKTVATKRPYAIDPALVAGAAPVALWTMGDLGFTKSLMETMRDPLLEMIGQADRAKVAAVMDEMMGALEGPVSARFGFEEGPKLAFAYDVIYTLKAGTDGKKLLADMEAMLKGPWLTKLMDTAFQGKMKAKVAAKRDGDALVMQMAFDTKKMPADMRAQLKGFPMFDGTPIEGRSVVTGNKMYVSTGSSTKARLAALVAAAPAAPAGDLADALTESKGDDSLFFVDLAALFRPVVALVAKGGMTPPGAGAGPNPMAMAGMASALLANARIATWGSYRGGETLTTTWRIPMSTFESVGSIVKAAMGGGH
jgi:hypothetical protein